MILTDSVDDNSNRSLEVLANIMAAEERLPEPEQLELCLFVLGTRTRTEFIKNFAEIGKASVDLCPARCTLDRKNLVQAFDRLAAQPPMRVALVQDSASTRPG